MPYISTFDCTQMMMCSWDSFVDPESIARPIDAFVNSLELVKCGVKEAARKADLHIIRGGHFIKQFKPFIIPVLCLTLIDQIIKMIISNLFMQYELDIITHLLRFNPKQNTNLSWFGNFVDIFSIPLLTVLFNILVIFIFLSGYSLYKAKTKQTKFSVKIILIFGLAGCFCSLIDKLFWGGSLDFLQIPNLFIFDIKDCYLTVAEIIFVVVGILHSKEISVKEYLHFCCNKFRL